MRKNLFLLVLALFTFSSMAFSQTTVVTGTVLADDGTPLPGAAVQIKGTAVGVTTDLDGKYTINVAGYENPVLTYSYVGYLSDEVVVGNQTEINVTMAADLMSVDEVVVVGYGTQKKSNVTGSISKVNNEDLVQQPASRVEQALQGKIAGVNILPNSGSPGAAMDIRIRGTGSGRNSQPLFIVDGMRTDNIDFLDPQDIESVEVLKDAASAAIYGSEGGNGVVLISTKKGKAGQAQINYSMYYGTQKYTSNLKVMDAKEYADYFYKANTYETQAYFHARGQSPALTDPAFVARLDKNMTDRQCIYPDQVTASTDWINEVIKTAPMQSHNLNISGGTEKATYDASAGYYSQDGVVGGKKANFNRYTFRLNGEVKANDWLSAGARATYSAKKRTSLVENNEFGGVMLNSIFMDPTVPVTYNSDADAPIGYQAYSKYFSRDDDGNPYGMSVRTRNEIINPVAQIHDTHGSFEEDKVLAGAYADFHPIKGLSIKSSVDIDVANNGTNSWTPYVFYSSSSSIDTNNSPNGSVTLFEDHHKTFAWQWESYANYNKEIGKHNFTGMVGYSLRENSNEWFGATSRGVARVDDNFAQLGFAQYDTLDNVHITPVSGRNPLERLVSYYGRLTYDYNGEFLLNLTVRRDGSSLLAPGFDFKTYPSWSVGYVLSNSSFFDWNSSVINYLKLRYSRGANGNKKSIDQAFYYAPLIAFNNFTYSNPSGTIMQGAVPANLTNEALTWESVYMNDIGVDMNLLQNKFTFVFDYYKKSTKDLLMRAQIPGYLGNNPYFDNVGEIVNSGLEFELGYRKKTGDLHFDISGNLTYALKNECVSLQGENSSVVGANLGVAGAVTRMSEGKPIGYYYGYQTDGIWKNWDEINAQNIYINPANGRETEIQGGVIPGDIKIIDQNNDSIINVDDKVMIGDPNPKFIYGFNFTTEYKGLSLSVQVIGRAKVNLYNGTYRNDIALSNKPEYFYTDAWSSENPDASWFRPTFNSQFNLQHNDLYVENGSFVKLKNVKLTYRIPSSLTKSIGIKGLSVYTSLNNLFVITKYRGADPEIGNTDTTSPLSEGVDRGYYPQPKSYLIGVDVTF